MLVAELYTLVRQAYPDLSEEVQHDLDLVLVLLAEGDNGEMSEKEVHCAGFNQQSMICL